MKSILEKKLDAIIDEKDYNDDIKKLYERLEELHQPTNYYEFEIEHDKAFETACLQVGKEMGKDAKKMSVMEFESALEILRKQSKELEEIRNKHK